MRDWKVATCSGNLRRSLRFLFNLKVDNFHLFKYCSAHSWDARCKWLPNSILREEVTIFVQTITIITVMEERFDTKRVHIQQSVVWAHRVRRVIRNSSFAVWDVVGKWSVT